jgi:hypothetical protein
MRLDEALLSAPYTSIEYAPLTASACSLERCKRVYCLPKLTACSLERGIWLNTDRHLESWRHISNPNTQSNQSRHGAVGTGRCDEYLQGRKGELVPFVPNGQNKFELLKRSLHIFHPA